MLGTARNISKKAERGFISVADYNKGTPPQKCFLQENPSDLSKNEFRKTGEFRASNVGVRYPPPKE
jgi:hypothetical protein